MTGSRGRLLAACLALAATLLPGPALAKKALPAGQQVDLNRASAPELMRLPGVGRKRADAILASRARKPFRRPEDVLRVKGFSRAWFERVKGHLAAGPPAPGPAPAPPRKP